MSNKKIKNNNKIASKLCNREKKTKRNAESKNSLKCLNHWDGLEYTAH